LKLNQNGRNKNSELLKHRNLSLSQVGMQMAEDQMHQEKD